MHNTVAGRQGTGFFVPSVRSLVAAAPSAFAMFSSLLPTVPCKEHLPPTLSNPYFGGLFTTILLHSNRWPGVFQHRLDARRWLVVLL